MAVDVNPRWASFIEEVPWFPENRGPVAVEETKPPGTWRPATPEFEKRFPKLTKLLRSADVTAVRAGDEAFHFFTWTRPDGAQTGWVSPVPPSRVPDNLLAEHQSLMRSCGGIVERQNEPEWWLLNHNDALTVEEAREDASFVEDYAELFKPNGIPIDLAAHYSFAREANGNATLCHRTSGKVLLFATDHAFDYVEPVDGCPRRTLYTLHGAPDFTTWVEKLASQWQAWLSGRD